MTITVAPYSPRLDRRGVRYWSVLVDGQLLVVTLYKKGALAVAEALLRKS